MTFSKLNVVPTTRQASASSLIEMRNALTVNRNNHEDIQGIRQTLELVRDEGQVTVSIVNVSIITNIIERGIITADFVSDLMVSGVYRYENITWDINVTF